MRRLNGEDGAVAVIVGLLSGCAPRLRSPGDRRRQPRTGSGASCRTGADAAALVRRAGLRHRDRPCSRGDRPVSMPTSNDTRGAFVDRTSPRTGAQQRPVTTRDRSMRRWRRDLTWPPAGSSGTTTTHATAGDGHLGRVRRRATIPLTLRAMRMATDHQRRRRQPADRRAHRLLPQFPDRRAQNTCGGPANQDHPGGFGWLNTVGGVHARPCNWVRCPTDTGNNVPNACSQDYFDGAASAATRCSCRSSAASRTRTETMRHTEIVGFARARGFRLPLQRQSVQPAQRQRAVQRQRPLHPRQASSPTTTLDGLPSARRTQFRRRRHRQLTG